MTYLKGVDISHWQNDPNPVALKAAGFVFIIHKTTEYLANPQIDSQYARRKKFYQDAGFLWAGYCYEDGLDGKLQADFFLQNVGIDGKTAIALDLEKYANLAQAEQFIQECYDQTGEYPILYSRYEYIINELHASKSELFGKCLLWIACPDCIDAPVIPLPWDDWYIWQWGSSLDLELDSVWLDMNWGKGTLEEFKGKWLMSAPGNLLKQVRVISPVEVTAYKTPNLRGEIAGYIKVGDMIEVFPQKIEDTENAGVFFIGTPENWFVLLSEVQYADNTNPTPIPDPTPPPLPPPAPIPVDRWVNTPNSVLNVHISPNASSKTIHQIADKTKIQVTPPVIAGLHNYIALFSINGTSYAGFVSSDFLVAIAPK